MKVTFGHKSYPFRPWKPEMGKVFSTVFSFDSETTLIDTDRPWITPAYVIGAVCGVTRNGGVEGFFLHRQHVAAFFELHRNVLFVAHHATFDLAVIDVVAPRLDIYGWVDRNQVWDTQLLHKLLALATEGHVAGGKDQSTLETCVQKYLGVELPKDVVDSRGQAVRLSYGRWLRAAPSEIEPIYLNYLAKDAIATFRLFLELRRRHIDILYSASDTWGFVSETWLKRQICLWGFQTHHIQLRAEIVLGKISGNGLHLDLSRRDALADTFENVVVEKKEQLREFGYLPGKGSEKALQAIFARLERKNPGLNFPRTDTGKFSTAHDAIQELSDHIPFAKLLLEYREVEKLRGTFLTRMVRPVLHPSFRAMTRSGRASSHGEINSQNLPKDDRIRSCFVPSPGHVFIDADYSTVEMATLAQACIGQFGLTSGMGNAINAGQDLHKLVAARVTGKPVDRISKAERQNAKPINFGKPGGMSNRTLKAYAKANYGVELTEQEVEELSDAWFELFPEMKTFLSDENNLGLEIATLFELTPQSHHEHSGDTRFLNHPENVGCGELPHPILGWMLLKTSGSPDPVTRGNRPYPASDIDYFWSAVETKVDLLPKNLRPAVLTRKPSIKLRRSVMGLVGRAGVFTFTGRLRADAPYCARHNTVFQGLAADGMKLALWLLFRAGYRIVNVIHDQVLVEVPANSDLKAHADRIRQLMITAMKLVVPDVNIDVSYAATDRWHKDAEAVFAPGGKQLLVWRPATAACA